MGKSAIHDKNAGKTILCYTIKLALRIVLQRMTQVIATHREMLIKLLADK